MKRSLAWLMGSILWVVAGCGGGNTGGNDLSSSNPDGATQSDAMMPNQLDGGQPLCTGKGCVGGPCTQNSDCTEGNAATPKVCWTSTLLNDSNYVPTPGGYCSLPCTSDADCGTGYCFEPPGQTTSYCMARCDSATTCRHPGYACTYEANGSICFPDQNLTCTPTAAGGQCDALLDSGGDTVPGGCIRAAYEDEGVCHVACALGTGTCPLDANSASANQKQHCVFIDTTVDSAGRPSSTGDKWKGPVCLDLFGTPTAAGSPCTYWDECQDGYQCDRYALQASGRVCQRLCAQGNGMQDPTLYIAAGGTAFTNNCPAGDICANELEAGTSNGAAGLCLP